MLMWEVLSSLCESVLELCDGGLIGGGGTSEEGKKEKGSDRDALALCVL